MRLACFGFALLTIAVAAASAPAHAQQASLEGTWNGEAPSSSQPETVNARPAGPRLRRALSPGWT
jgi:hypothetical protein